MASNPKPEAPNRDEKFLAAMRTLPCLACGRQAPSEAHHIRSRGAGGGDDAWNVIPLFFEHHTGMRGWHVLGPKAFLAHHIHVWEHLKSLGWQLNDRGIPRFGSLADDA